ncbi:DUF1294 domain-containing protein [Rheinheimera sp. YQF-2]|uniref:DUF1294 domain-containing protein n=1 Tax=Rheinheimera lutimaris TaxID=2740584 RepID=A0A7Y5AN33_9GAMM|nr:cold shock and DUF1294 domain-containing protein [Rheinheimera lutimaris]NRQ41362.1 DUF1294 domain-containing protein [Rheinheimera lutimaris]
MRLKGKIEQWDDAKGFGFIVPALRGERVFVHANALQNRRRRPLGGDVVTYSVTKDNNGRRQAHSVTFAGEKLKLKAAKQTSAWPLRLVLLFFILLGAACYAGKLPLYVVAGYAVASLITYLCYAWDKRKAQKGHWRTPESTLHLLALSGGWPGAWLAQSRLRHKSKKRSFRLMFCVTVLLNIAALVWLISPLRLTATALIAAA